MAYQERRGVRLTSVTIVHAALELVDKTGLEGFTTRKLASRLGISSPSLYHHFASMGALIDAMALDLMRRFITTIDEEGSWEDYLCRFAKRGREMNLSCRDGARILTAPVPRSIERENIAGHHARYLMTKGFTREGAYRALGLISSFVGGWTLNEQNRHEWVSSVMDLETAFTQCVEDIVSGLRANFGR